MPPIALARLSHQESGTDSATIRMQVEIARARQRVRYGSEAACNARAPGRWLESKGGLEASARNLLTTAGERPQLSARAFHRVLRVARTIADLAGEEHVRVPHVSEALAYRPRAIERDSAQTLALA